METHTIAGFPVIFRKGIPTDVIVCLGNDKPIILKITHSTKDTPDEHRRDPRP